MQVLQMRSSVNISLVLLQLALSSARPVEEALESVNTPLDAEKDRFVSSEADEGNAVLADDSDWPEENDLGLENENGPQKNELLDNEDVLLESRSRTLRDRTLTKGSRIATPRSRFPAGVAPAAPSYGYSRFYPSNNPTSYYYPPYQPTNYVPNGYYPGYPSGYAPNYFPSNPAYPPSYYPSNPAAYPISSPYDYYPIGNVNEYARKHTIN